MKKSCLLFFGRLAIYRFIAWFPTTYVESESNKTKKKNYVGEGLSVNLQFKYNGEGRHWNNERL